MNYAKIELIENKRSRRTLGINMSDYSDGVYIDLKSSAYGSEFNYFALLGGANSTIEFALGGAYHESDANDLLPTDDDFQILGAMGHFEAQGRMFNTNLRLWIRGVGRMTLIY